jgi:hypothetical protein
MSDRGQVLRDALEVINGERQDQYGSPEDSFALIAEYWAVYLRNKIQKERGNIDVNDYIFSEFIQGDDVAYMMTLFKIARENFQHKKDNLVDAAGYLGIAGDMFDDDDPDIDDTTGESLEGNPVYEPPNCCPDRDQAAPDSLSLKQIRKKDSEWLEKLRIQLAELEKQQAKQPSLADLVDWDEAFAEEIYAIQMEDGDIWVCERYCVSSKGHYRPKGLHHLHKRNAPLAHDWQTPLRRPVPNANVCPHCGELTDFKECDCQRMKEDEAFEFLAMRQQWHDPTPSDMPSGGANG